MRILNLETIYRPIINLWIWESGPTCCAQRPNEPWNSKSSSRSSEWSDILRRFAIGDRWGSLWWITMSPAKAAGFKGDHSKRVKESWQGNKSKYCIRWFLCSGLPVRETLHPLYNWMGSILKRSRNSLPECGGNKKPQESLAHLAPSELLISSHNWMRHTRRVSYLLTRSNRFA